MPKTLTLHRMDHVTDTSLTNQEVYQLCTAMCLLNPDFLQPLLDGGLEKRYSLHPNVFLNDLKNILLDPKTKVKLGHCLDGAYVAVEDQIAKMTKLLQATDFVPSKDWTWLLKAKKTADNILRSTKVLGVYWTPEEKCDLYLTTEGRPVRVFLGQTIDSTYSAEEFGQWLTSTPVDLTPLLDQLTVAWCLLVLGLPADIKKYAYAWNFKENLTWAELQSLVSEKHLGEDVEPLRFRYKKFTHFAKDALRNYSEPMRTWQDIKENLSQDFWLKIIVPALQSTGVEAKKAGFYSETASAVCASFLKEHFQTEGYDNYYTSTGGERLDIYSDEQFSGPIYIDYLTNKGKFILRLTTESGQQFNFGFDFIGGEMISEPLFRQL